MQPAYTPYAWIPNAKLEMGGQTGEAVGLRDQLAKNRWLRQWEKEKAIFFCLNSSEILMEDYIICLICE